MTATVPQPAVPPPTVPPPTVIGVLGTDWRARVSPGGAVEIDGVGPAGEQRLDWWVAADDRWHDPAIESSVRQVRLSGTPVVETRVRVPQGDVLQRVYAVATDGGLVVVEIENASPMPVAVALSRPDVLTSRPPADVPIEGISLPAGSIVVPIGHRATVRVAVRVVGPAAGPLPDGLPTALQVSRGWLAQTERASRLVTPDESLAERLVVERCELALGGVDDPTDDPVAFLLGAAELTRLGWSTSDWMPDIAGAASDLAAAIARRRSGPAWDEDRALLATEALLAAAGDRRGASDAAAIRRRLGARSTAALTAPSGVRGIAWVEDAFVRPAGDAVVLHPAGHRTDWLGQSVEVYRMPAPGGRWVSYALRWHGDRPAVLWEVAGDPGLGLTAGADADWATAAATGEALWAAPAQR